jgi:predicted metalloprotease with PDZ domain
MSSHNIFIALASLALASPSFAQRSAPEPLPLENRIAPVEGNAQYSWPMQLNVDATDIGRSIFRVKQTVHVPGTSERTFTLLYPEWLPGKHGPRGAIAELAGLIFKGNGKILKWERDPLNVYAFHIAVPADVKDLVAEFQFLSPVRESEGRIVVTQEMMNVQWEQVSLYPAGYYTRNIRIRPSITLPEGWAGIAALDGAKITGNRIDYSETDYETFIDSPMFAGKNFRKWDLGNAVTLNVFADEAKALEAKPEHIAAHKALVDEALLLFGAKHFDRYEFLLALTDRMGGIGLEHHRSSENTREPDYFTEWAENGSERGLLPHELVHSWNGKFRRPAKLWTPNYDVPMQDNLLWVYEGQTSYWDIVLAARSGIQSKEMALAEWARVAGTYSEQAGRQWRSVEDTTHDPIMASRKPRPFSSQSRNEDYYNESSLIWLEADMTIRQLSKGKKSLDDFARAFFGIRDGDWGTVTYDFDEVVRTLNTVQPYDWAKFLDTRLRQPAQPAPLGGIEKGGYRLVWKEEANIFDKERMKESNLLDLTHSLGFVLDKEAKVASVQWGSPAFQNDIVNGAKIMAVGGMTYSKERLLDAINAAKDGKTKITLLVLRDDRYRSVDIGWHGGLRYPHLEKGGTGAAPLDLLLEPRRSITAK